MISFESFLGTIRMFYPTCYVYKIAPNEEPSPSNETATANKKADVSSVKKSKIPTLSSTSSSTPTATTTPLNVTSKDTKNDSGLIKSLANQLLISAQRNNCVDLDKKYV